LASPTDIARTREIKHQPEIGAGEPAQALHRDDIIYSIPQPHPEFEVLFILALTEFTAENGATRIAPGSHRWGPERIAHPEESVPAVMPAGSVVFFLGSTWHSGGHNRSTSPRFGGFAKYSLGQLRQEENQFLSVPPEVARTLDDDLLKLIGYQEGAWAMGYFRDFEDPLRAIRGDAVPYGFDASKLTGSSGADFADQLAHSE